MAFGLTLPGILESILDLAQVPQGLSRAIISMVPKLTVALSLIWMVLDSRRIGLSRYEVFVNAGQ